MQVPRSDVLSLVIDSGDACCTAAMPPLIFGAPLATSRLPMGARIHANNGAKRWCILNVQPTLMLGSPLAAAKAMRGWIQDDMMKLHPNELQLGVDFCTAHLNELLAETKRRKRVAGSARRSSTRYDARCPPSTKAH